MPAPIEAYGLSADDVRDVMRQALKAGSYWAWCQRLRALSGRREIYR